MLFLELFRVIVQKGFISGHLVSYRHHADLIDGLLDPHRFDCEEKFLGDIEDLLGEVGPFALRLN